MLGGIVSVEFVMSPYPRRLRFLLLSALLVSFVFIHQSRAQQTTASISGAVKDPSGAVLPQASVTATNASTGTVDKTVSDASGVFELQRFDGESDQKNFQRALRLGRIYVFQGDG